MGAVGIPALQQIRGYSTPRINQMAEEGILFTRMYSQPSCLGDWSKIESAQG
jgi:arylsulfatase